MRQVLEKADLLEGSTNTVISKMPGVESEAECAVICLKSELCKSMFYRQMDGYCQTHSDIIGYIASPQHESGMIYSAIMCEYHLVCTSVMV